MTLRVSIAIKMDTDAEAVVVIGVGRLVASPGHAACNPYWSSSLKWRLSCQLMPSSKRPKKRDLEVTFDAIGAIVDLAKIAEDP